MPENPFHLDRAPIVEAVLDIECDLTPDFALPALEQEAVKAFAISYPLKSYQLINEFQFKQGPEGSSHEQKHRLQAIRFHSANERELIQIRNGGFSFNRLAPYDSLDAYLPMLKDAWITYLGLAKPVQVTGVRLRYINRIEIPGTRVELGDYFHVWKSLPEDDRFTLNGVLTRYTALEDKTGNEVKLTLTDAPEDIDAAVIILDIEVGDQSPTDPEDWAAIEAIIQELRKLKNDVFRGAVTDKCLQLFQDQ